MNGERILSVARHHARSGEIVDLRPLGEDFPNGRTTAIVKTKGFEAIHLVIPAGREIPAHEVAGDITLYCLEGRVALDLPDAGLELAAGDWVYLEGGAQHQVKAIEDASMLLTILLDH